MTSARRASGERASTAKPSSSDRTLVLESYRLMGQALESLGDFRQGIRSTTFVGNGIVSWLGGNDQNVRAGKSGRLNLAQSAIPGLRDFLDHVGPNFACGRKVERRGFLPRRSGCRFGLEQGPPSLLPRRNRRPTRRPASSRLRAGRQRERWGPDRRESSTTRVPLPARREEPRSRVTPILV